MTTLYLVRHAEAEGNHDARFQGHTDGGISENGEKQLERLAWRFKNVPLYNVYSSPLRRAAQTAKAVNTYADLPIIFDRDLIEINGGAFEGVPFDELPKHFPEAFEQWSRRPHEFQAPGGESMRQVYERMQKVMHRLIHANMERTIAVVSHGCAIRNYICYITGVDFEDLNRVTWCDNTGVSRIDFDEKWHPKVRYTGDVTHLPQELSTLSKQNWWRLEGEDEPELYAKEAAVRG